jgi:fumarate reductase flavoprotein subunit
MSSRESEKSSLKADLAIIGGGGAGLAAAVAAAEKGAKNIILLEKRGAIGGNTAMSSGLFAAGSPAQKRAAIDARREVFFKILVEFAHWKVNPRIVRAFIDKSADTIRWLEDKGLAFDVFPMYPNQIATWHQARGNRGAEMVKVLAEQCQKLGVKVLTSTSARKILTGTKGKVTRVIAESEGKEFTITAKGVIIATGGYGGNKELLKKYCPAYRDNMLCDGLPHLGDGLLMAMEIGAATEGLGLLLMSGPQIPNSIMLSCGNPPDVKSAPLMAIALEPNTVWVNKNGERFADEAVGYNHYVSANTVNRQPGNLCYTLLDQKIVKTMEEEGLVIGLGRTRFDQRTKMPGLERELRALTKKGWVKISDFWDEIANWIGTDPEVLKATVDEYNDCCAQGYDSIFAKDRRYLVPLLTPPYYAIRSNSDFLDTIGGIKINERMEVIDTRDNPIPGLYAAGVVAGGWQGDTYCVILSGAASGFAVNSGRIAAENAVKILGLH